MFMFHYSLPQSAPIYIYILIFNINVSETVQIMSLAMAHRYVLR